MAFSEITDRCLKNGFELETNLSEIKGDGVNELIDSLKYCLIENPNMPIIERIMYEHKFAFKTQVSIKEIMRKSDPVISAFTILGNCDRNCNMKWLIKVLDKLREFRPLQNIVDIGPPLIKLISPISGKIKSGDNITFEISTISNAHIQWWKHYNGSAEIVFDQLVKEFTVSEIISYKTKETDNGNFHIEINCRGQYRKLSSSICVGDVEPTKLDSSKTFPVTQAKSDGVKRIALLVGIMNYRKNNQKLKAPETDIFDLERVLLELGFTVFCFGDLYKKQMESVLKQFSDLCEVDNTIIFFYFAGHGFRKEMGDNLELIDEKMPIKEVLEPLVKREPKLIVALFDMCRDSIYENVTCGQIVVEAISPISEKLIVVMSTLPTQKSYETKNGSLIMIPLCDNLRRFGSRNLINFVLTRFLTSCESIVNIQKPTLVTVTINEVLGINILISRIKLRTEWVKIPENPEIMKSLTIDNKVFHNFINIYINKININNTFDPNIRISTKSKPEKNVNGIIQINLFDFKDVLKKDGFLLVNYQILETSNNMSKYQIRIFIPEDIILFL